MPVPYLILFDVDGVHSILAADKFVG
jgi:hypothetical protein